MSEMLLPQNGDTLFRCQGTAVPIRPKRGVWPAWSRAYRAAADMLVDAESSGGESGSGAEIIYPILYLYRHFLELEIKSVVVLTLFAANAENVKEEAKEISRTHDLMHLLQLFATALMRGVDQHEEGQFGLPSSLAASLEPFLVCVEEMPKSDLLRYPVDQKFGHGIRPLDGLDLTNLKLTMSKLANFLTATRKALEDLIGFPHEETSWMFGQLGDEDLRNMTIADADELF
jgi:hypothetical protein